ncbi:rhomboid-like protein [Streptomyces sp. SAJ15]|uniref:rhomboid-like protein n=1 Tax=Streptomyces sp. SAJ15 TaxID=2011095 RepID=UPI001185A298|nr:rhomboid-like protein [Streptomyces sp. SAJ15]TVL94101.1 hypothetical protein CD790_03625 [Streptomyces sp. SAJ15]
MLPRPVRGRKSTAPAVSTPQLGAPARPRTPGAARPARAARALARLVPTPARTPFTLGYGLLLLATSVFADLGDPETVRALLAGSSTDVSHLAERPLLVLLASGAWVAGGLLSPSILVFLSVLTSLERRVGGPRTAAIFLSGHVAATVLTEVPVAVSVAVGHLPESSLNRLDYGISYGLMASVGALAGLLRPRPRWSMLAVVGGMLATALWDSTDPLTDWGHAIALLVGLACWPYVRQVHLRRTATR